MIGHNLKIAWRNLLKYKLQSAVSVFSLTIGIVCFALSALWLQYESSYDTFWKDADRIHMLQELSGSVGNEWWNDYLSYSDGPRLMDTYPEIESVTRCCDGWYFSHRKEAEGSENTLVHFHSLMVDSAFQDFFAIKVLEGRRRLCLGKTEVALTESACRRLFPEGNAVGQFVVDEESGAELRVVAIIEDGGTPSVFPYEVLRGYDLRHWSVRDDCRSSRTFVKVVEDNIDALNSKVADGNRHYRCIPIAKVRETSTYMRLQVKKNHLELFLMLGVVVICCAMSNYFTMLLARVRIRQRELALRYVHGASLRQLVAMMATEITIILVVSIALATLIAGACMEPFKETSGIERPAVYIIGWMLIYALLSALVSVAMTALIVGVSSRKQLDGHLGKRSTAPESSLPPRINIVVQLAVSIGAVFCSSVMMRQIDYLVTSPDMGFTKHNIGILKIYSNDKRYTMSGKDEVYERLKALPEVDMALLDYIYPVPYGAETFFNVMIGDKLTSFGWTQADEHYFGLARLQMVEGEFVRSGDDKTCAVINETAARLLGENGKVGKRLREDVCGDYWVTIKGIVKDMHYLPPTMPPAPMIFTVHENERNRVATNCVEMPFRWKEGVDWESVAGKVFRVAEECGFGGGFGDGQDYATLCNAEEAYNENLQSEFALCSLLLIVTGVCIAIAVVGIFSIVSLACERRRKEVALRKIHGATMWRIYRLFLGEYMGLLVIGGVIAFPIGHYLMHQWQMQYVKQAPIPLWLYPGILAAMALLILVTVFRQIWKVAKAEPDVALKSE